MISLIFAALLATSCSQKQTTNNTTNSFSMDTSDSLEIATFGAGCFWCIEACFSQLNGVNQVLSGYMGGATENPTYKDICTGKTGHAEVAQIMYNPAIISYEELLEVFWFVHDPTQLNRQGNDIGTQYRSVIFFHNNEQKEIAEFYKKKLNDSGAYSAAVVTEISAVSQFYVAEDYHQGYFVDNPNQPYCSAMVRPKVEKFTKVFADKLTK